MVDELIEKLKSPSCDTRFRAARALVKLGPWGSAAIPDLIDALTDDSNPVADSAAWALGTMGPEAIKALQQASQTGDMRRRTMAICAIGRYSTNAAMRFNAIEECTRDAHPEIRKAAGYAIISLANQIGRDWQYRRGSLTSEDISMSLTLLPVVAQLRADASLKEYSAFAEHTMGFLTRMRDDLGIPSTEYQRPID